MTPRLMFGLRCGSFRMASTSSSPRVACWRHSARRARCPGTRNAMLAGAPPMACGVASTPSARASRRPSTGRWARLRAAQPPAGCLGSRGRGIPLRPGTVRPTLPRWSPRRAADQPQAGPHSPAAALPLAWQSAELAPFPPPGALPCVPAARQQGLHHERCTSGLRRRSRGQGATPHQC